MRPSELLLQFPNIISMLQKIDLVRFRSLHSEQKIAVAYWIFIRGERRNVSRRRRMSGVMVVAATVYRLERKVVGVEEIQKRTMTKSSVSTNLLLDSMGFEQMQKLRGKRMAIILRLNLVPRMSKGRDERRRAHNQMEAE